MVPPHRPSAGSHRARVEELTLPWMNTKPLRFTGGEEWSKPAGTLPGGSSAVSVKSPCLASNKRKVILCLSKGKH